MDQEILKSEPGGPMVVALRAEVDTLQEVLDQLKFELADATFEVRQLALDFIDRTPELVCLEQGATTVAGVTVLLKPSQRLVDLVAAVRTGDIEFMVVKNPHLIKCDACGDAGTIRRPYSSAERMSCPICTSRDN